MFHYIIIKNVECVHTDNIHVHVLTINRALILMSIFIIDIDLDIYKISSSKISR